MKAKSGEREKKIENYNEEKKRTARKLSYLQKIELNVNLKQSHFPVHVPSECGINDLQWNLNTTEEKEEEEEGKKLSINN